MDTDRRQHSGPYPEGPCQRGDTIKAGQSLAVIEAMKMETTVTSPIDGTASAVLVKKVNRTRPVNCCWSLNNKT